MGEKGERRKKREKDETGEGGGGGEESRERMDGIWISLRKDGNHNSTCELCGKAICLLFYDTMKEHGKVRIWGDI